MKTLYPVLPELAKDAAGDTSKFQMTPGVIHFCAKLAHFSRHLVKVPADFTRKSLHIPSYDGKIVDAILYTPKAVSDHAPCLVYYPGGGFVVGAYPYMHTLALTYARYANCKVLFVNYRLANAPCYTATIEDCYYALQYVWNNSEKLDIDREHITVMGDSAGATLATIMCIMARDRKGPAIRFQMLVYPMTMGVTADTCSRKHFTNTPGMNSGWCTVFLKEALKNGLPEKPEYFAPYQVADCSGLPPAYIETEEFCPLRDEGDLYARKLAEQGVHVIHRQVKGTFHAFDSSLKRDCVQKILKERGEVLKEWG